MSKAKDTFRDWYNQWRPYLNPYNENASFHGTLFYHYGSWGEELKRAKEQDPRRVWSLVPIGNHGLHIESGIHPEAEGYFITKKKRRKGDIQIVLYEARNCRSATIGLGCC